MHRVVLDARAIARLLQHLDVIHRALPEAGGFQYLALTIELSEAIIKLRQNVDDGDLELVVGGDEVLGRIDLGAVSLGKNLAGEWVELDDAIDLVSEEFHADGQPS